MDDSILKIEDFHKTLEDFDKKMRAKQEDIKRASNTLSDPISLPVLCVILDALLKEDHSCLLPENITYKKDVDPPRGALLTQTHWEWPTPEEISAFEAGTLELPQIEGVSPFVCFLVMKLKKEIANHFKLPFGTDVKVNIFDVKLLPHTYKGEHFFKFAYVSDQPQLQLSRIAAYALSESQKLCKMYGL